MTSIFHRIAQLQPTLPGWCTPEKAEALAAMVLALRPKTTVEIGVFGGSSFIPMAMVHHHLQYGIAIGIDPWSAQASVVGQQGDNLAWWSNLNHEQMYERFCAQLESLGLTPYTHIQRQTSDRAIVPLSIDLLHIDGNHGDQAVKDVGKFAPRVRVGGLCVLDDLDWPGGAVVRAEARLLQLGYVKLYALGTGAAYQRVK